MFKPLVSILMNCYNGEKYLEKALESVFDQHYKNWELIFWDNVSSDKSEKILKDFKDSRIKYFKSGTHTSQYEARNKGLEKCNGDFIAFLDVDDWWLPTKLEEQIKLFENPNIGFSCTNSWVINERIGRKKKLGFKKIYSGNVLEHLLIKDFIVMSSLVIRRSILQTLSINFNPKYEIIGDLDLVLRLSTITKLGGLQTPLVFYRLHENNLTYKKINLNFEELKMLHDDIKSQYIFNQNKNFDFFVNNVVLYGAIYKILNRKRFESLKDLKMLSKPIHIIKFLVAFCLPNKIILNWKKH
jgi:glycosyltransferase involved in cell wall biosynthesis